MIALTLTQWMGVVGTVTGVGMIVSGVIAWTLDWTE